MATLHYELIPVIENHDPMVDLTSYPVICEPAYFQRGLTDTPKLYTRLAIADKLVDLQNNALEGYQFKIWDPWRSREVQHKMFDIVWDKIKAANPELNETRLRSEVCIYVADPDRTDRVPSHSTGGSIDLTLVDKKTMRELDMGTGFDHIGIEAAPDYFEQSDENPTARHNRRILRDAMLSAGFTQDPDEWWHFDYGNQKWAEAANKDQAFYGEVVDVDANAPRQPSPKFSYPAHASHE